MPGKEKKVEEPIVEPSEEKTPEPEPQTKTFTQEEMDAMITQTKEEELAKYQGIQRTIARKDQEIERLKGQRPQSASNKALIGMLEEMERKEGEYGADPSSQFRITQLKAAIREEEQNQAREAYTREYREKLVNKIVKANYDPDDARFDDVWESFETRYAVDGKFELTDKRLDRILGTKPNEPEKPKEGKETLEQQVERLAEERARQILEERGQLTTETGGPSASSGSLIEAMQLYIQGKITAEEAKRRGCKFD